MNMMKRYWDLERENRALLTEDDVRSLLKIELMEKGILEPKEPELLREEPPNPVSTKYYEPCFKGPYGDERGTGFAFPTLELAHKFIELKPQEIHQDGYGSDAVNYMKSHGYSVRIVDVLAEDEFTRNKSEIERAKNAKQTNSAARNEYDKQMRAVREASKELWSDWSDCRAHRGKLIKVRETWDQYLKLCNDDAAIAKRCIAKSYGEDWDLLKEALGQNFFDDQAQLPTEAPIEDKGPELPI